MRIIHIFLVLVILGLSILQPLSAPNGKDTLYSYLSGLASGEIACHCDAMKLMEDTLRQDYTQNIKVSYLIDCSTNDKQVRNHIAQVRTLVSPAVYSNQSSLTRIIYPTTVFSAVSIHLSTDNPPPRYSA